MFSRVVLSGALMKTYKFLFVYLIMGSMKGIEEEVVQRFLGLLYGQKVTNVNIKSESNSRDLGVNSPCVLMP